MKAAIAYGCWGFQVEWICYEVLSMFGVCHKGVGITELVIQYNHNNKTENSTREVNFQRTLKTP